MKAAASRARLLQHSKQPMAVARSAAPSQKRIFLSPTERVACKKFPLPLGGVAVWWMDPEQIPRSYVERYAHWLSATELSYICSGPSPLEEHTRLCSRVLLRSALATCLGRGWQLSDFSFQTGEHGKPYLVTDGLPKRIKDYDFNLTHTEGLIGLAVAAGVKVGIDCERIDRQMRFQAERIAERMFSPMEREELMREKGSNQRKQKLLQQWTLKEAMVKATGRGLAKGNTRLFSVVSHDRPSASLDVLSGCCGCSVAGAVRQLTIAGPVPVAGNMTYALLQCVPSAAHVGALCVELPRGEEEEEHTSWAGLDVRQFRGLPGEPADLQLADIPLLAAT